MMFLQFHPQKESKYSWFAYSWAKYARNNIPQKYQAFQLLTLEPKIIE